MFDNEGQLWGYDWYYYLDIYCTPELVVEIYPSPIFFVDIWLESQVSTNHDRLLGALSKEKIKMIDAGKRVANFCQGTFDPVTLNPNEVIFFGDKGFYPQKLEIKQSDKLKIYNYNPYYLGAVFLFVREQPKRLVFNSKPVANGNTTEVEFKETGEYTFFFEQYPARAIVNVTYVINNT